MTTRKQNSFNRDQEAIRNSTRNSQTRHQPHQQQLDRGEQSRQGSQSLSGRQSRNPRQAQGRFGDQSFNTGLNARGTSWQQREGSFPYKADYSDYNISPYERNGGMWYGYEQDLDSQQYSQSRRDVSQPWSDEFVKGHERINQSWNADSASTGHQSFVGKGPKGYKRSDERIKEDVCECLASAPRIDASEIEVNVKDCCVNLSGTVNSRQAKREAEMLVENLNGVEDVINEIRVKKDTETSWSSPQSNASDNFSASSRANSKFNDKNSTSSFS